MSLQLAPELLALYNLGVFGELSSCLPHADWAETYKPISNQLTTIQIRITYAMNILFITVSYKCYEVISSTFSLLTNPPPSDKYKRLEIKDLGSNSHSSSPELYDFE